MAGGSERAPNAAGIETLHVRGDYLRALGQRLYSRAAQKSLVPSVLYSGPKIFRAGLLPVHKPENFPHD